MQMPPPPPSSSSDGGYLGIPAMSSRLKLLEEKILRQIGPFDASTSSSSTTTTPTASGTTTPTIINRPTSRNNSPQIRQLPSQTNNLMFTL